MAFDKVNDKVINLWSRFGLRQVPCMFPMGIKSLAVKMHVTFIKLINSYAMH